MLKKMRMNNSCPRVYSRVRGQGQRNMIMMKIIITINLLPIGTISKRRYFPFYLFDRVILVFSIVFFSSSHADSFFFLSFLNIILRIWFYFFIFFIATDNSTTTNIYTTWVYKYKRIRTSTVHLL